VESADGGTRILVDPKAESALTDLDGVSVSLAPDHALEEAGGVGAENMQAMKGALRASVGPDGGDASDAKAALSAANRLASDPRTYAGMRANRQAFAAIPPETRAKTKAARFAIVEGLDDVRADLIANKARDNNVTDPQGHGWRGRGRAPAPMPEVGAEIKDRFRALLTQDGDLPTLPHPTLDPGLSAELGLDAVEVLETQAFWKEAGVGVGLSAASMGTGAAASGVLRALSAGAQTTRGAKAAGDAASAIAGAGTAALLAKDAATQEIYHRTLEDHGLDPQDPEAWDTLPEAVRRDAGEEIGMHALVAGVSPLAVTRLTRGLTDGLPAPVKTLVEGGANESLQSGFRIIGDAFKN